MNYEATGTIKAIFDTRDVSEKFRVREFVLEVDDGKYPQMVKFQTTGDKCERLSAYAKGDQLRVEFNLRGREYTSKKTGEVGYFNSLDAWRFEKVGEAQVQAQSAVNDDELPF